MGKSQCESNDAHVSAPGLAIVKNLAIVKDLAIVKPWAFAGAELQNHNSDRCDTP
jgi:hypothetical protein